MLTFAILGPLEVLADGRSVAVGGRRPRALLAVLLLDANTVVPRQRLIESVWGEEPPRTVAAELNVYLSRLRALLSTNGGGAELLTRPHGYELRLDPDVLDLTRFDRLAAYGKNALAAGDAGRAADALRDALALWQGPALADLPDEPFAEPAVARLEELRLATLEDRIRADLALGRHDALVPELYGLVRELPYRERLRSCLMLALYRSGRQADALAAYREARRLFAEELGTEPGRDLRRLELAILRQDVSLDLPEATPRAMRRIAGEAEMHERFAEWLAQRGEPESPEWEELLAHHLEQAFLAYEAVGDGEKTAEQGRRAARGAARAGRRALDRSDVRRALALLARARSLTPQGEQPPPDLTVRLGDALLLSGDVTGAYAVFAEAADVAAAADNDLERFHAGLRAAYARAHVDPGEREQLARLAREAVEFFAAAEDHGGLSLVYRISADVVSRPTADAVADAKRARRHALEARDVRMARDATSIAVKLAALGGSSVQAALADVQRAVAGVGDDSPLEHRLRAWLGHLEGRDGNFAAARRAISDARAGSRSLGNELNAAAHATSAAIVELLAGNPRAAEREARLGLEALEAIGDTGSAGSAAAVLAEALADQRRADEALTWASRAEHAAYEGDVIEAVGWRVAKARALTLLGRHEEAIALATDSVEVAARSDYFGCEASALAALAAALEAADRRSEAASLADRARAVAERQGDVASADRVAAITGSSSRP